MYPYISITDQEIEEMLKTIGISSTDELYSDIPENVRFKGELNIPKAKSEVEVRRYFDEIFAKNTSTDDKVCFLGGGAYDRYVPSVIPAMASRSEFYTSYTPYQPEISQGTLSYIFEYQTMMANLTGMPISNASLYDGGTAITEAALMTIQKSKKSKILCANTVSPSAKEILLTYCHDRKVEVEFIPMKDLLTDMDELEKMMTDEVGTVIVQSPNYYGYIEDVKKYEELTHSIKKNYLIMSADPMSLGLLKKPSEYNVDVVVGEAQQFGVNLQYGGPYLGYMCFTDEFVRKFPGRVVGQTTDEDGKRSFVLTLSAREQHIKRDRATSNICSNQGVNLLAASIYLSLLGKAGIKEVATQSLQKAHYLFEELKKIDKVKVLSEKPFFDEFTIGFDKDTEEVKKVLFDKGFLAGISIKEATDGCGNGLIIAVTEKRTKEEMDNFVAAVKEVL